MGIYLGANALGGGGGTPIGGFSYFAPPTGTTFTSGQEVYTNADTNTVWLRSGAQLTSAGASELDATLYRDKSNVLLDTNVDVANPGYTGSVLTRISFGYLGAGYVGSSGFVNNTTGKFGVSNANTRTSLWSVNRYYGLFDGNDQNSNGASAPGNVQDIGLTFSGMATNDTHMFLAGNAAPVYATWVSNDGSGSTATNYECRYIPQSVIASSTSPSVFIDNTVRYVVPSDFTAVNEYAGDYLMMAITNSGTANERHWFAQSENNIIREYSFDNTTTTGNNPWTATGNTIDLTSDLTPAATPLPPPGTSGHERSSFQGDGNFLYYKKGTDLWKINATTRAVDTYISDVLDSKIVIIPASASQSGSLEYYIDISSTAGFQLYEFGAGLTAPYIGTFHGTRNPVVLTNSSGTEASDGLSQSAESNIYLWMRIA